MDHAVHAIPGFVFMIAASASRWHWLAVPLALVASLCTASAAELSGEQAALHVLNRLGYGPRPGDVARVVQMGVDRYIDQQLHPETIPLPADLRQTLMTSAVPSRDVPLQRGSLDLSDEMRAICHLNKIYRHHAQRMDWTYG